MLRGGSPSCEAFRSASYRSVGSVASIRLTNATLDCVIGYAAPPIAVIVVVAVGMARVSGIRPIATVPVVPMMRVANPNVDVWSVDVEALRLGCPSARDSVSGRAGD